MKRTALLFSFLVLVNIVFGGKPHLSFFCELPEKEFTILFSDSSLINELSAMRISIRIGLHDFGKDRTTTIKRLNQAGIPVYAWLLLPEEDGYWFNMYNGIKAQNRYEDFKKWTAENQIKWEGIGLDLEPDMNDAKLLMTHPWKFGWKAYKRLYDNKSLNSATVIYQKLISSMKADGYLVESYIIPFLFEERAKKTKSLQKLLGIVDIETEKEIPMSYTSGLGNPAIIPLYHTDNMPIALGSTGGGVKIEGFELAALTWDKLERDLIIASKLTDEIVVFCLETSVQKGFLENIKKIDFNQKAPDISIEIEKQKKTNNLIRFILVILDRPFWLTIGILLILSGIVFGIFRLTALIIRLIRGKHH
jgi:hypothetical protein